MNKWVFNSILPFVNKDVELLERYKGKGKRFLCKCKICGKEFYNTPLNLLYGEIHSNDKKSPCRKSNNNKYMINSKEAKQLLSELYSFYNYYSKNYNIESYYKSDDEKIKIIDKKTKEIYYVSLRQRIKPENPKKNKNKDESKLCDRVYHFYDKENEDVFVGTVTEFLSHIDKVVNYKTLDQLKQRKWFKQRFKIVSGKPKTPKPIDEGSTYIRVRCDKSSYCLRTSNYLCGECRILGEPYYTKEEYNEKVREINKGFEILENFSKKDIPIKCKCERCGYIFEKMPRDLLNQISCSNCNMSKGEQIISTILNELNISYVREKQFSDLSYKKPLRFDFYLSDYNAIIEFDGKQHFRPVMFYTDNYEKAKDNYRTQKIRDKIKNQYCKDNNIPLLRIKYDEKEIKRKIKNFIKRIK